MVGRAQTRRCLAVAVAGLIGLAACEPASPAPAPPPPSFSAPSTTTAPPATAPATTAPATTAPATTAPATTAPATTAPATTAPATTAPAPPTTAPATTAPAPPTTQAPAPAPATSAVALAFGSTWRWSHETAAPPTTWRNPGFDDRAWASGPGRFGFGDDAPKATVISTTPAPHPLASYYRTTIDLDDPARFETYAFDVVRDGGVAIHVNGVEVARHNLTPGPVTHDATWAAVPVARADRDVPVRLEVPASVFRRGTNTIAVQSQLNWRSQPNARFDLQVTGLAAGGTEPAPPPARPGWDLLFSEDFEGTAVDPSRWRVYHNTYGDGNNELACLTPDNVAVGNGSLQITAKREQRRCPNGSVREFTSGFLGSREVGQYFPRFARFEMRAKLPHGQALWPAFWLRHRNGASVAEVDILEYFHSIAPGQARSGLHLDGVKNTSYKASFFEAPTRTPGWHTFAVEILPAANGAIRFDFFIDGTLHHSFTDTKHNWSSADPNATWDIAVNMAVGGDWVGHPDGQLGVLEAISRCAVWNEPYPNCSSDGVLRAEFPEVMEVDWIRVHTPR